ncbi:MAG: right-handed parallel beta-helix repeat-containing protein [Methanosarcina mazei]
MSVSILFTKRPNMISLIILSFIFVNINANIADAKTIYVSTDGSGDFNCDGIDDEVEINKALEFAYKNKDFIVHLNGSTYMINDTILIYSNVIFEGDGKNSVIKLKNYVDWPQNKHMIENENNVFGNTNITLCNFHIDGNKANQFELSGSGYYSIIHFQKVDNSRIENLLIENGANDGIRLVEDCSLITVNNTTIEYMGHAGIKTYCAQNITAYNNLIHHLGNSGLRIELTKNSEFYDNKISYTSDAGIQLAQSGVSDYFLSDNLFHHNILSDGAYGIAFTYVDSDKRAQNNSFYNNIIYNHNKEGIRIQGARNTSLINNVIYNVEGTYGTGDGIFLTNLDYEDNKKIYPDAVYISNSIINNCKGYGINGSAVSKYNDFWNNLKGNYGNCSIISLYDINTDPIFADPSNGDFHLKSEKGRWDGFKWVTDSITSPLIDSGDPSSIYSKEPSPNGNRINIGAYGNTIYASLSSSNSEEKRSKITVLSKNQTILPNQSFEIKVSIDPSMPISGAQLDFTFNSSMTSVVNVTEGNLLKQSGAYTIFSSGTINNSVGTVKNIYGFILGSSNASTPGTMATVNLTAGNKTGMAEFSLSNVIISDVNSKSAPYNVTNATILIDTAPVIASIGPKSVNEKSTLAFKVSAKDADGDRLVLSASGVPKGAVLNTTSGNFTWTPAVGQAGVYKITFKVSDGYLTDLESVIITVNTNNPPLISSFEPLNGSSFSEGERIRILVNASDANGQTLDYSIRIDGVVYATEKEYVWETDYSSSGNHTIEVVVSDGIDEVKKQHIVSITDCRPRWDVNEDGIVNILDITIVSKNYGAILSKPYPRYDVNQDGEVNIQDLTLVGHYFGEIVK